LMYIVYF